MGITPMPCLGWQRPAAAPCRVCPFLNLSWGCSLATSCHTHVNSDVRHLLVSSGLKGPCWDLGLVTGANTAPGIGCRPWVSGVLGCSCRGVSLLLKSLRSRCWSSGLRLMAVITFGAPKRPVSTGSPWHLAAGRLAPDINPRGAGPPAGTALLFQISGRSRILGPRGLLGWGWEWGWHFPFVKPLQLSSGSFSRLSASAAQREPSCLSELFPAPTLGPGLPGLLLPEGAGSCSS